MRTCPEHIIYSCCLAARLKTRANLNEPLFSLGHLVARRGLHHRIVRIERRVRALVLLRQVLALVAVHVPPDQDAHQDQQQNEHGKDTCKWYLVRFSLLNCKKNTCLFLSVFFNDSYVF